MQNNENAMRKQNLAAMQFDDLWQLYEELAAVLADKITAEKRELEGRLAKLKPVERVRKVRTSPRPSLSLTDRAPRRKYPEVFPKYGNPLAPSQKWSGRGKRPKWVIEALAAGQRLDDLKIEHAQNRDREDRARGDRTIPAVR
jgi:DNA-binding protein H-NS